tara:strand:- start:5188 stop:6195 length:1008 start_codon:yes stop_codon:yes gene_type:complete
MVNNNTAVWIKRCVEEDTGSLSIDVIKLATFEEETWKYDTDKRTSLRNAWKRINVPIVTINDMVDQIVEFDVNNIPVTYVGDIRYNIIPDIFEPDAIVDVLGTQRVPLFAGDYIWKTAKDKIVTVERKQLENGELLTCLFHARGVHAKGNLENTLTTQCKKMDQIADIKFLLIEMGNFQVNSASGYIDLPRYSRWNAKKQAYSTEWSYKWVDVQKRLTSLADRWGVKVWYTYDGAYTVDDLEQIRKYLNKPTHSSETAISKPVIVTDVESYNSKVQSLCFIEGFGPKISDKALKHFGTLRTAALANEAEWLSVEGIGKKLATSAYEYFNNDYGDK